MQRATDNLKSMSSTKYLTNNHNAEATSPRKLYNVHREQKEIARTAKGIYVSINEDMNNILRVQDRTSKHDLEQRKKADDNSTVLLGVARKVELIPELEVYIHSRRMLNLAGHLSASGRLVMSIDGTGGMLNLPTTQHHGKCQHVFLTLQLGECILDHDTASRFGKNLTNVVTVAERIGSSNTAIDFECWLKRVKEDTIVAMGSYVGSDYAYPLRPTVIKMDCALQLLNGCLGAFRNEEHVSTGAGYNSIVYLVLLWHDFQMSTTPVTNHEEIAMLSLQKILKGCPCIMKQCKVHAMKAIRTWPATLRKKPSEIRLWSSQFDSLFLWLANHLTSITSVSELIVRICVVLTVLGTEYIPCGQFDLQSITEDCHLSSQSKDIARRMDLIMKEAVADIQIQTEEDLDALLSEAYLRHRNPKMPYECSSVVEKVMDRMKGRIDGVQPMPFSITYLSEKKGDRAKLTVVHVVSPYAVDEEGEEFVSPKLVGGFTVDISLPHVTNRIPNPFFSLTAANYVREQWLNRVGLWNEGIIAVANMAMDAKSFSNNQCSEGFIRGVKDTTTFPEDVRSIADLIDRRYEDSIGMGMLVSNQIDEICGRVEGRRNRAKTTGRKSDVQNDEGNANMEWRRTPGTTVAHLKLYKEILLRAMEMGSEKGNFQYDRNRLRSIWDVVNEHAISSGTTFMSISVMKEWFTLTRKTQLRKEWADIIDDFYNVQGG